MSVIGDGPNPGLAQFAISVKEIPKTTRFYVDVLGCLPAGGLLIWGERLAKIQGIEDPTAALWWGVDKQDYVQMEFWQYSQPLARPRPHEWKPCDIGYTRMGFVVDNFDATISALANWGIGTLTPPMGPSGNRRAAFQDPDGILIELIEQDPLLGSTRDPRWADSTTSIRSISLSVPDIERAYRFWIDTIGLEVISPDTLHTPEMEAIWGLPDAKSELFLARAGDGLIEVQQYKEPTPRPKPEGALLNDLGILNVALGWRAREPFEKMYQSVLDAGYTINLERNPDGPFTSTYLLDDQNFSLEVFYCDPSMDKPLGFEPDFGIRNVRPGEEMG